MTEGHIFIKNIDGTERSVERKELIYLKKDIVWVFDQNGMELHNSHIPIELFTLPYWEYTLLEGDKGLEEKDINFYKEGAMIILLCMVAEYIDIPGGNQLVFGSTKIASIINYIEKFKPANDNQAKLKESLLLGLSIASSITNSDIVINEDYKHPDLKKFYSRLNWVTNVFITAYYRSRII